MEYKYVHLLWLNELKFNSKLPQLFYNNELFDFEQHYFITPFEEVYNEIKQYGRVELISEKKMRNADTINSWCEKCEILFVHYMCTPFEILRIKRKYLPKIVWRTWGGDGRYECRNNEYVKNSLKKIIMLLAKNRVKTFRMIGYGNLVDRIDLFERFGNTNLFRMPYINGTVDSYRIVKEIKDNDWKNDNYRDTLNIMIGHSGFPDDYHLYISKLFEKFKDENIRVFFVFSYGDQAYMDGVKRKIIPIWEKKAIFVEEFMDLKKYCIFLNSMDIAVFNNKGSYALGNISRLLFLGKTIILNKDGVINKAFEYEDIPHFCVNDIKSLTYEKLKKALDYNLEGKSDLIPKRMEANINLWISILSELEVK
jgi:hypothetical protein